LFWADKFALKSKQKNASKRVMLFTKKIDFIEGVVLY
jgi:hypothetical protein